MLLQPQTITASTPCSAAITAKLDSGTPEGRQAAQQPGPGQGAPRPRPAAPAPVQHALPAGCQPAFMAGDKGRLQMGFRETLGRDWPGDPCLGFPGGHGGLSGLAIRGRATCVSSCASQKSHGCSTIPSAAHQPYRRCILHQPFTRRQAAGGLSRQATDRHLSTWRKQGRVAYGTARPESHGVVGALSAWGFQPGAWHRNRQRRCRRSGLDVRQASRDQVSTVQTLRVPARGFQGASCFATTPASREGRVSTTSGMLRHRQQGRSSRFP